MRAKAMTAGSFHERRPSSPPGSPGPEAPATSPSTRVRLGLVTGVGPHGLGQCAERVADPGRGGLGVAQGPGRLGELGEIGVEAGGRLGQCRAAGRLVGGALAAWPPVITGARRGRVPVGGASWRKATVSRRPGPRKTCLAPGSVALPGDSFITGRPS